LSKELVVYYNARGIVTEAEPRRINIVEHGIQDTAGMEGILTAREQAEELVALGIHWLAPAFGNVHGPYRPKGPQLDFSRLDSIASKVGDKVRLVLHGAHEDYFKQELLRKCICAGIGKANIDGPVAAAFTKVQAELAGKAPLTTIMEGQAKAVQAVVENHLDWLLSTSRA
jgi:fructose-bisphosphate aldolase, class II